MATELDPAANTDNVTITASVPVPTAKRLLTSRGWRIVPDGVGHNYVRPGRKSRAEGGTYRDGDYLWHLDEAVEHAIAECADEIPDPADARARELAEQAGIGLAQALEQACHEQDTGVPPVRAEPEVIDCPTCSGDNPDRPDDPADCPTCTGMRVVSIVTAS